MSMFGALSSAGGAGGGYSASSGVGPIANSNHSVNILGSQGSFDINQYLSNASGPSSNGGWSSAVSPPGFAGGLTIGGGLSPQLLLLGGVAILAVFLLLRR